MKHLIFFGKRLALFLVFACLSFITMAQPGPIDPNCDPLDPLCPIDDYYAVFIFAVLLIAAYKAYKRKKSLVLDL